MNLRGGPFVIEVEAGKKAFCTCGASANLPYCDGSHKRTGGAPKVVEFEEAKRVAICGCGRTENSPFCDGSHARPPQ